LIGHVTVRYLQRRRGHCRRRPAQSPALVARRSLRRPRRATRRRRPSWPTAWPVPTWRVRLRLWPGSTFVGAAPDPPA